MKKITQWHHEAIGEKVVNALMKNNFDTTFVKERQEAVEKLLEFIPASASVGFGSSVTLEQLGIVTELKQRGNPVLDLPVPVASANDMRAAVRRQLLADVYLSGTNAVTLDGKLVNVDGTGNRVGAMLFGPDKVFIVAGINKIVKDVKEAENRIKVWVAPQNSKRRGYPNPCTKAGVCVDCQVPTRICNITVTMHKRSKMTDVHVVIVGEEFGF